MHAALASNQNEIRITHVAMQYALLGGTMKRAVKLQRRNKDIKTTPRQVIKFSRELLKLIIFKS